MQPFRYAGCVGEQVPHRSWAPALIGRDQPKRAEVVIGRRIEVQQPSLPQLHHRDCGEVLVIDPIRKTVSSVIGVRAAMSATPC
jgi:hypothetical protein